MRLLTTSVRASNPLDADTTADTESSPQSPTFITIQSLATFPGAALGITIVWKFCDAILGIESRAVPVAAGLAIGALLYWMAWNTLGDIQARVAGAAIALINAMYLILSVLGIDIGLDQVGIAPQTVTPTP